MLPQLTVLRGMNHEGSLTMKATGFLTITATAICMGSGAWAGDIRKVDGSMRQEMAQTGQQRTRDKNTGGGQGSFFAHFPTSRVAWHYRNTSSPRPKF